MCTSVEKERHYEKIMSCLPNTNGTDKPRWEMCREELPCVFRNYTILELERNLAVTRASIGGSPHCFVERKSIREPIQFYLNSDSDLYQPCDFVWVWLNLSRLHFYLTFVGDKSPSQGCWVLWRCCELLHAFLHHSKCFGVHWLGRSLIITYNQRCSPASDTPPRPCPWLCVKLILCIKTNFKPKLYLLKIFLIILTGLETHVSPPYTNVCGKYGIWFSLNMLATNSKKKTL